MLGQYKSKSDSALLETLGTCKLSYPTMPELGCLLVALTEQGCRGTVIFKFLPPHVVECWKRCLSPNRPIHVLLEIAGTKESISVDGHVAEIANQSESTEIGICFTQLTPQQRMSIQIALQSLPGARAAYARVEPTLAIPASVPASVKAPPKGVVQSDLETDEDEDDPDEDEDEDDDDDESEDDDTDDDEIDDDEDEDEEDEDEEDEDDEIDEDGEDDELVIPASPPPVPRAPVPFTATRPAIAPNAPRPNPPLPPAARAPAPQPSLVSRPAMPAAPVQNRPPVPVLPPKAAVPVPSGPAAPPKPFIPPPAKPYPAAPPTNVASIGPARPQAPLPGTAPARPATAPIPPIVQTAPPLPPAGTIRPAPQMPAATAGKPENFAFTRPVPTFVLADTVPPAPLPPPLPIPMAAPVRAFPVPSMPPKPVWPTPLPPRLPLVGQARPENSGGVPPAAVPVRPVAEARSMQAQPPSPVDPLNALPKITRPFEVSPVRPLPAPILQPVQLEKSSEGLHFPPSKPVFVPSAEGILPASRPAFPVAVNTGGTTALPGPAKNKLLGQILLGMGKVTAEQIQTAADQARVRGERLGRFLVRSGKIGPDVLCRALALQSKLPVKDLDDDPPSDKASALFPIPVLQRHQFIPFDITEAFVCVAATEPMSQSTLEEMQRICGRRVEVFLAREDQILKYLEKWAKPQKHRSRRFIRYDVIVPISYQYCARFGAAADPVYYQGVTLNLSEGGILIEGTPRGPSTPDLLLRGGMCLNITMVDAPVEIHAICRLKTIAERTNPKTGKCWQMGLEIADMSADNRRKMKELCFKAILKKSKQDDD